MAAEYNLDDLNKHYLYLERLASGGINSVVLPSLDDTYRAVADILNGYDGITSRAELNAITKAIYEAINSNAGWATLTADDLAPLALYEAEWQANYAAAATGLSASIPAERTILNFINRALMSLESGQRVDVGVWGDFVESNIDSRSKQINGIVQRGFMRGETIPQMRRQIKQVTEGLLTREAEALARTGYVHYAAQATEAMVQANNDILEEYYYVITFDNRTSDVCKGVSQYNQPKNRFKVGDPKAPTPPLHFSCRTRRLAVPEGFELTGTRAAVGGKKGEQIAKEAAERQARKRKGTIKYKGKKDADIFKPGQIDADITMNEFFQSQPLWWLESNMGKTRARLVKDGKLNISKLTDANLKPLTLAELRELHPSAFNLADL
ncbi:MAG: minor capsid protein [Pseudomonadota bacterium]|nr:minor capsid protein [Pseudomonadota bacterium]